jgi:hypothetical protein
VNEEAHVDQEIVRLNAAAPVAAKKTTADNDRNNSKSLGSRIALRLKFPAYYPPGRHHHNAFAI